VKLINQGHKNEETKEKVALRKVVAVAKTWESVNRTKTLMRMARGDTQEFVNWTKPQNRPRQRERRQERGSYTQRPPFNRGGSSTPTRKPSSHMATLCTHCGDNVNHDRQQCWVFVKKIPCNTCGKPGHLSKECRFLLSLLKLTLKRLFTQLSQADGRA